MLRPTRRAALGAFTVVLAGLGAAACADSAQPVLPSQPVRPAAQQNAGPAAERLATLVALSLRDASVRAQLHAATQGSPVKEGKIFLSSYLHGQGRGLLNAMTRASGASEGEVLALLAQTGPMEIYLPVAAQRAAWKGGDDLIVATQLDDRTTPFGVDLNGNPVKLSHDQAPATPTLSIVPAESFDASGRVYGADLAARALRSPGTLRAGMNPDGTWTGLWVNEVHTSQTYEPWTKGDPEFEMHIENAQTRATLVCAEEDNSIEPYRWNMNSTNYTSPFLIAGDEEMPEGTPYVVSLYEDDTDRCVIRTDLDDVKIAADALNNASSAYKAIKAKQWNNGQIVITVWNAIVSIKNLLTASDSDDFAGVTAGLSDIGATPVTANLKDRNMNNIGWVTLQWKSDVPH